MSIRPRLLPTLGLTVVLVSACGSDANDTLVARASEYELSVNEAVNLLASATQLPNDSDVVEALAQLWIDYVLLAEAGRQDSTMAEVDVQPLVRQQVERRLVLELRDSVIHADTAITESELQALYQEEGPGVVVHARHILLTFPDSATALQQDSVRRLASEMSQRIVSGGVSFEDMARQYSQDPGTARNGGDLGEIAKGQSMPALEDALFSMQPGEVSAPVESPYGLHILRVDERSQPSLDDVRLNFRFDIQQRRYQQAESVYVRQLVDQASLEPVGDAAALTRQMAENPGAPLGSRAGRRTVVRYAGGTVTLQEVQDYMLASRPDYRAAVVRAPDDAVEDQVLREIVQRKLVLAQAREMGFSVPAEVQDSLARVTRANFVAVADRVGLLRIRPREGQSSRDAVEARVESILREMLSGNRDVIPIGAISYTLRKQFPNGVFEAGIGHAVLGLAQARGVPIGTPRGSTQGGGGGGAAAARSGDAGGSPSSPEDGGG